MSKTMSVRMDRENYDFLHEITKEEGSDLLKLFGTWSHVEEFCLRSRGIKRERPRSAGLRNWRGFRSDR